MTLSILPYVGSKRTDIQYFEKYLPENIKTIVEPFGGSGYLSLYLFSKNPKLKCIVNDIDVQLINFFNQLKLNKLHIVNGYNKIVRSKPTKEEFNKIIDEFKSGNGTSERKAILYLSYNKYHGMRIGLYPINKSVDEIDIQKFSTFFDWITKSKFTNEDYSGIFKKYKNNKSVFMFLDPPYFDSFNGYYFSYNAGFKDKKIIDNTKMFIDIINYLEDAKCKTMLIINKNAIIEYIFKDYIVAEYDKIYQLTKKETVHLIICNYQ